MKVREAIRRVPHFLRPLAHRASGHLTHDPVTGDDLTVGEAAAWRVQWIIRRWTFLVVITALTALAWTYVAIAVGPSLDAGPAAVMTWWNCAASYLALLIESVVGMAMYHQTQRDAQVIREVRKLARAMNRLGEDIYDLQLRNEK